jgi:hypothetical protein
MLMAFSRWRVRRPTVLISASSLLACSLRVVGASCPLPNSGMEQPFAPLVGRSHAGCSYAVHADNPRSPRGRGLSPCGERLAEAASGGRRSLPELVSLTRRLERIIPSGNNLRELPLKVFFALGNIRPEPFAERSVVVFKPFVIP